MRKKRVWLILVCSMALFGILIYYTMSTQLAIGRIKADRVLLVMTGASPEQGYYGRDITQEGEVQAVIQALKNAKTGIFGGLQTAPGGVHGFYFFHEGRQVFSCMLSSSVNSRPCILWDDSGYHRIYGIKEPYSAFFTLGEEVTVPYEQYVGIFEGGAYP